jgi:membrane-bound lytic murein transglycosylase B
MNSGFFEGFFVRRCVLFLTLFCFLAAAPAAYANTENFKGWLQGVRREAKADGISDKIIRIALPDTLKPIPLIIKLDRRQPETTKTFSEYFRDTITDKRVDDGRSALDDNRQELYEIGANYGVDPQYIVALWGIETNYGRNAGSYNVVQALATLAYDGRRSAFFRAELMKALKILDQGDVSPKNMKGSWAGAMGQTQFMPSSFFKFAQDYNKDGKRDIWKNEEDVFASAAYYLAQCGWKHGEPWGRRVALPKDFDEDLIGLGEKHTLEFWRDHGVHLKNGDSLPFQGSADGSIIQPDGPGTTAYIVYENYRVLLKWNKSTYFATSVGLLADAVKG